MPDPEPQSPAPINLSSEIVDALASAMDDRHPVDVAYVDADGRPHLSLRGTVQVFSPDQLALWARSPGLTAGIAGNPHVALLYQNLSLELPVVYMFSGRARIDDDEAVREKVFTNSPEREQGVDPERKGVAVIIDLDTVAGRGPSGRLNMARGSEK
jgi:hypothetical protein